MAIWTFLRHSSLTQRLLLSTRETVPIVTPALFATSLMVAILGYALLSVSYSGFFKAPFSGPMTAIYR
jgi:hypothetical protein